jgi:hypothetical protein
MTAPDRRHAARLNGGLPHGVRAVRIRTGHRTTLVDVSADGMGLETDASMAPGAPVDLVVVGSEHSQTRRAFVVHARVCRLHPTEGARFRIGVRLQAGRTGINPPGAVCP